MTQLQAGEMAPDFKSTTQDGEPLTLADLRGQRTILYFYPKDNTSGCTLEAKSLRDGKAELTRMGFRIIGVSPDSEKSHRSFCDKHDLNFTLLADTDHSVCEAYGVWAENRCTDASTWAYCARRSSSTPKDASNRFSRR
jgi:AhpC/TSA family